MGILFSNYLDEGYYEYNDFDGYSKLKTPEEIVEAEKKGNLYHHDGFGMTKV